MARTVVIGTNTYKQRNIVAVWLGLPLITLGIYTWVWYFKINDEARRYLRDDSIHPGVSTLAISLGSILIVPYFVSIYNTAGRIKRMEAQAGLTSSIEPVLALVLIFVFGFHSMYMQSHLNHVWEMHLRSSPTVPPASPPITTTTA